MALYWLVSVEDFHMPLLVPFFDFVDDDSVDLVISNLEKLTTLLGQVVETDQGHEGRGCT